MILLIMKTLNTLILILFSIIYFSCENHTKVNNNASGKKLVIKKESIAKLSQRIELPYYSIKVNRLDTIINSDYFYFSYELSCKDSIKDANYLESQKNLIDTTNIRENSKRPNKKYIYEYNSEYKISHQVYEVKYDTPPYLDREYISILSNRYMVDSLYFKGKNYINKAPLCIWIRDIYTFNFQKRNFLVIHSGYTCGSSNTSGIFIFLFDITNQNNIIFIHTIDFQSCMSLKCFGDFDKNGYLDYVFWYPYQSDKNAYLYSLKNNEFVKNGNYFLNITEQNGIFLMDYKKSQWIYDFTTK